MRSDNLKLNNLKLDDLQPNAVGIDSASLCSFALALWGWQTGLLWVAVPIICILEARRVIKQRWQISLSDLKEAAKLSVAILAMLLIVLITTEKSLFIYSLFQWSPVAALPFVLAQTYGLGVQTLLADWLSSRDLPHQDRYKSNRTEQSLVTSHSLYFGLCLLAASAADSDRFFFYGAATALVALFLWTHRPKRSAPILWLLLFCLSAGLGFAGHIQLAQLQRQLEAQMIAMIGNMASGAVNPNGNATQMGSVGRLKLSSAIAFRAAPNFSEEETAQATVFPLLLQQASYNQYQLSAWSAVNSVFDAVPPGEADGEWILGEPGERSRSIIISSNLERGDGVLSLPRGTSTIRRLPVEEMQRNQYGAVQVNATGNADYEIQFGLRQGVNLQETRPTAADLQVPNVDKAAIEATLEKLALAGKSDRQIANQIAAYFQDFQYSLDLLRPDPNTTPISDFLLNTRAGHCEYFASATALLLRGAGIPARYAVGYLAHEFSPLEGQYIVRSRDAHAWALAYLDGSWQVLDTTPPDWTAQEKEMTSTFRRGLDFFSFLEFQFSYQIRQLGELGLREILLIVIPLFCYLLWRSTQAFKGQRQTLSGLDRSRIESSFVQNGLDSEFYQIEKVLNDRTLARLPSESLLQWRDRIQPSIPYFQRASFTELLALHYRYRFDPTLLSPAERQKLQAQSQQWIRAYLSAVSEPLHKP